MPDPDITPPYRLLAFVCACLCVPPLWALAGGAGVGGFRMFTRPQRAQLQIELIDARGQRTPFALERLRPHLGSDARRVVLSAARGSSGETAIELLARGLPDLGRLSCRLTAAQRVSLRLTRSAPEGELPEVTWSEACDARAR